MTPAVPTDAELVDCAAQTYTRDDPFVSTVDNAIRAFLTTRADGLNIIAIEGTHDVGGWAIDFCALAVRDHAPINHASLGMVHAGFLGSALSMLPKLSLAAARGPYAICGHSLGAALALLCGALLIDDGCRPTKIGAFAPPRVGAARFVKIATSVPFCAYRFGDDPVPLVPFTIPPLWLYKQVPLTEIGKPLGDDSFACHAITNYVSAITA